MNAPLVEVRSVTLKWSVLTKRRRVIGVLVGLACGHVLHRSPRDRRRVRFRCHACPRCA